MSFEQKQQAQKRTFSDILDTAESVVFEKKNQEKIEKENEDKKEIKVTQEQLKAVDKKLDKIPEDQLNKFLSEIDPRNQGDEIEAQYYLWLEGNPKKRNPKMPTWGSRISHLTGTLLFGTPRSLGMPDYYYYLPYDREVCFPDLFENIETYEVSRNVLYVNRHYELLRRRTQKIVTIALLGICLSFGTLTVGVKKVNNMWEQHKQTVALEKQMTEQNEKTRQDQISQYQSQLDQLNSQKDKLIAQAKERKAQLGDNPDPAQIENLKAQFKMQDEQLSTQIAKVQHALAFFNNKEAYDKEQSLVAERDNLKQQLETGKINEKEFFAKKEEIANKIKELEASVK